MIVDMSGRFEQWYPEVDKCDLPSVDLEAEVPWPLELTVDRSWLMIEGGLQGRATYAGVLPPAVRAGLAEVIEQAVRESAAPEHAAALDVRTGFNDGRFPSIVVAIGGPRAAWGAYGHERHRFTAAMARAAAICETLRD